MNLFSRHRRIATKDQLEKAALDYGILPFFTNPIRGFSVAEMAAPGMLFADNNEESGCWEWKGPVIQEQTTAYGKFFKRKAGFVSLELLPDFLNYRRWAYPVEEGSADELILHLIRENEGLSSTQLKELVFGRPIRSRKPFEPVELQGMSPTLTKRKSLEGPLQRLQMGGHILIANFEYKYTRQGQRYGWGVAVYSTPEIWFDRIFTANPRTPLESLEYLTDEISKRLPGTNKNIIRDLLK